MSKIINMFKPYILALLFLGNSIILSGQSFFQKTFGDSTISEKGLLVYQTTNGTIYFFGHSVEGTNGDTEITMQKLDSNGNILSKKVFVNTEDEYPINMVYNNGVFVIVGEQHKIGTTNIDGLIMMVDTLGQVLNYQTIGALNKTESFQGISKTSDGGYIIGGFASGQNGTGNDVLTMKLNPDLSIAWQKKIVTLVNDVGTKSIELPNGNFITVGDQQQVTGNYNVYYQIFDATGNFLFSKTISTPYNGGSKTAILDSNNDILILGEMDNAASFYFDIYLVKLDANTNLIWEKYLTSNTGGDAGFGIIEPNVGDYVICGYGANPITNNQDVILISTDTSGTVIETKYYGSSSPDIGYNVCASVNSGFLVSGFVYAGLDLQYFLIYDDLQVAVNTNNQKEEWANFVVFPNPLTTQFLQFSKPIEKVNMSIFNQNGELVEQQKIQQTTAEYTLKTNLASGNYFIHFEFEHFTKTVRIVIL